MKIRTKYALIFSIVSLVVTLDLITKAVFSESTFKTIIPHLIDFESNQGNDGAAFGIFGGKKWFLIALAIVMLVLMLVVDITHKSKSKLYITAFAFMFGGALGNLVDRIWLGYVRDFIKFDFWKTFPTFNIADSFLCVGVALLCIYLLFLPKEKQKIVSKLNNQNKNNIEK